MSLVSAICLCAFGTGARDAAATAPTFEEVSSLVRSNLAGATPEQLDRVAVDGLLQELSPRVTLVANADDSILAGQANGVVDARVYRDSVGYLRLAVIDAGASEELHTRFQELVSSNRLSGLVLDLRMATGDDYAAALSVANLFLAHEVPLLNWGEGLKSSNDKPGAITLPVAVLVNGQTGGGAEALAAMLRKSGVALLIGSQTAGTAGIQRAFPLANGQFLKITVANIQLGDAQMLSAEGLKPDVEVAVSPTRETAILNGDLVADGGGEGRLDTNTAPSRTRMNEADLVKRWRGEMLSAEDFTAPLAENGPERHDPALLRALDLMDGLAILRSWQK